MTSALLSACAGLAIFLALLWSRLRIERQHSRALQDLCDALKLRGNDLAEQIRQKDVAYTQDVVRYENITRNLRAEIKVKDAEIRRIAAGDPAAVASLLNRIGSKGTGGDGSSGSPGGVLGG